MYIPSGTFCYLKSLLLNWQLSLPTRVTSFKSPKHQSESALGWNELEMSEYAWQAMHYISANMCVRWVCCGIGWYSWLGITIVNLFFGGKSHWRHVREVSHKKRVLSPRPFQVLVVSNSQETFQRATKDSIPEPIQCYWVEFFVHFFSFSTFTWKGYLLLIINRCSKKKLQSCL